MSDAQDAGEPVTPAWMTAGIRQAIRALGSRMTPVAGDAIDLMTLCKMVAQSARTADPQDAGAAAEMLARELWAIICEEALSGGTEPAFHTYADDDLEPCVWDEQDANVQQFWIKRAERLLAAARIRSLPTPEQALDEDGEPVWSVEQVEQARRIISPHVVASVGRAVCDAHGEHEVLYEPEAVRQIVANALRKAATPEQTETPPPGEELRCVHCGLPNYAHGEARIRECMEAISRVALLIHTDSPLPPAEPTP